jgi:glucose/arabinose dehydrogenase
MTLAILLFSLLPGFRVETIANVPGVVSSVVADSHGVVYCTTTSGTIFRIDGSQATPIATLPTHAGGNGGLLGMALADDHTAVVHYTTWSGDRVIADVISTVDLASGAETVLRTFVCDITSPDRGASAEHHGGNPTIAPDGSILVGIGEYNDFVLAQEPEWNAGKVFRVFRDGSAVQFAHGLRNPYDLVWDPTLNRIVLSDNGPTAGDELHIVNGGDNLGWPDTFGHLPQSGDSVPPIYVFPSTVAPTGLVRLTPNGNAMLRGGYLSSAFVTKAVYYFPDITGKPVPDPIPIVEKFDEAVIDVTQTPNGDVLFGTVKFPASSHIQRLIVPRRGDCDGDGFVDWRDLSAEISELGDGDPHDALRAQDGLFAGSWGCDVNGDGVVARSDFNALVGMLIRRRAVRTR